MRDPDAVIPANERLFRGLLEGWIDGDTVTFQAIDHNGTSVNRETYSEPGDLIARGFARVGVLRPSNLPPPMTLKGVEWRFFAFDCPNPPEDPTNDAHAELRTRRPKDGENPKNRCPGSPEAQNRLRVALAEKFSLL